MQVRLRGGRADGQRLSVPDGTTELSVPALDSKGFDNSEIYRPSGQFMDGIEVWDRAEDPWTETGAMPLA